MNNSIFLKFINTNDEIEQFIKAQGKYALISEDTPLISNLDMCENIALMKAVHENMSIVDANRLAIEIMSTLGLEHIAYKRVNSCTKEETLLVLFMRAIMSKEEKIIMKLPDVLLDNLLNMKNILDAMSQIKGSKEVIIVDLVNNKNYYEGSSCSIKI